MAFGRRTLDQLLYDPVLYITSNRVCVEKTTSTVEDREYAVRYSPLLDRYMIDLISSRVSDVAVEGLPLNWVYV